MQDTPKTTPKAQQASGVTGANMGKAPGKASGSVHDVNKVACPLSCPWLEGCVARSGAGEGATMTPAVVSG